VDVNGSLYMSNNNVIHRLQLLGQDIHITECLDDYLRQRGLCYTLHLFVRVYLLISNFTLTLLIGSS